MQSKLLCRIEKSCLHEVLVCHDLVFQANHIFWVISSFHWLQNSRPNMPIRVPFCGRAQDAMWKETIATRLCLLPTGSWLRSKTALLSHSAPRTYSCSDMEETCQNSRQSLGPRCRWLGHLGEWPFLAGHAVVAIPRSPPRAHPEDLWRCAPGNRRLGDMHHVSSCIIMSHARIDGKDWKRMTFAKMEPSHAFRKCHTLTLGSNRHAILCLEAKKNWSKCVFVDRICAPFPSALPVLSSMLTTALSSASFGRCSFDSRPPPKDSLAQRCLPRCAPAFWRKAWTHTNIDRYSIFV